VYVLREYLAPALAGLSLEGGGREAAFRMPAVRGHRMAKAALENAVWDAEAQAKQVPLWKLVGGTRKELAAGVSIGIQDSHGQLLEKVCNRGCGRVSTDQGEGKAGWDLEVLAKIREQFPAILLSCDANSAYTLDDMDHLKQFDQFRLLMIEQPLWSDEIYLHALLQQKLSTNLCLDESITNARAALAAIELRPAGL